MEVHRDEAFLPRGVLRIAEAGAEGRWAERERRAEKERSAEKQG